MGRICIRGAPEMFTGAVASNATTLNLITTLQVTDGKLQHFNYIGVHAIEILSSNQEKIACDKSQGIETAMSTLL